MSHKGNDPFCCCTGCQQRPIIQVPPNGAPLTLLQINQFCLNCCACIPYYVCVTITNPFGQSGSSPFIMQCLTAPSNELVQPIYVIAGASGQGDTTSGIDVGGEVIDVQIYFIVTNGQCFLAIRSTVLGVNENSYGATRLIDAAARANGFCSSFELDHDYTTTFNVANGYKIIITALDHVPINGRPQCVDENGIVIPDTFVLQNACCNCDCICNCMCLTITSADGGSAEIACLYNGIWTFSNGVVVTIGSIAGPDFSQVIGCWNLDEWSGTRIDSTSNNNLQDVYGIGSEVGVINRAAAFVGGQLLYANADDLSLSGIGATIACWVNFVNLTSDMAVMSKTEGNGLAGFSWKMWLDHAANRLAFSVSNGTTITTVRANSFGALTVGPWFFVSCRIDPEDSFISIQVNNASNIVDTAPWSGTVPVTYGPFCVGGQNSTTTPQFLVGGVDQAIILKNHPPGLPDVGDWGPVLYNSRLGRSCNADDRCYLSLKGTDTAYGVQTPPAPVLLDIITNPCPRPTAQWFLTRSATAQTPYAHQIYFRLACAGCGNNCTVNLSSCCPSGRVIFPTIIYANITTTCYLCPSMSIELGWDGINHIWTGFANVCGREVTFKISCPFKMLAILDPLCAPGGVSTDSSASCDPILGHFSFLLTGIGCCGVGTINNPTMTVVIHE